MKRQEKTIDRASIVKQQAIKELIKKTKFRSFSTTTYRGWVHNNPILFGYDSKEISYKMTHTDPKYRNGISIEMKTPLQAKLNLTEIGKQYSEQILSASLNPIITNQLLNYHYLQTTGMIWFPNRRTDVTIDFVVFNKPCLGVKFFGNSFAGDSFFGEMLFNKNGLDLLYKHLKEF